MPIAIIMGLFFGKQLGIVLFSFIAVQCKIAKLPENIYWKHVYGISILCGIGFTMSLFIGTIAFENNYNDYINLVRIGVLGGSILSAVAATIFFKFFIRKED